MAKLIKIADWLSVNPDHVASVRDDGGYGHVTIEMVNGTRHSARITSVKTVTDKLNGEGDA